MRLALLQELRAHHPHEQPREYRGPANPVDVDKTVDEVADEHRRGHRSELDAAYFPEGGEQPPDEDQVGDGESVAPLRLLEEDDFVGVIRGGDGRRDQSEVCLLVVADADSGRGMGMDDAVGTVVEMAV